MGSGRQPVEDLVKKATGIDQDRGKHCEYTEALRWGIGVVNGRKDLQQWLLRRYAGIATDKEGKVESPRDKQDLHACFCAISSIVCDLSDGRRDIVSFAYGRWGEEIRAVLLRDGSDLYRRQAMGAWDQAKPVIRAEMDKAKRSPPDVDRLSTLQHRFKAGADRYRGCAYHLLLWRKGSAKPETPPSGLRGYDLTPGKYHHWQDRPRRGWMAAHWLVRQQGESWDVEAVWRELAPLAVWADPFLPEKVFPESPGDKHWLLAVAALKYTHWHAPPTWDVLKALFLKTPLPCVEVAVPDIWTASALLCAELMKSKPKTQSNRMEDGKEDETATPETDTTLIYQADAADFYNIAKSTLSKAAKKKPSAPGYLWSGTKGSRRFYRKADLLKLSRSRQKLKGV